MDTNVSKKLFGGSSMETLKISFVYDAVYPWVKGGAEKRIYEIGRRLADRGHEVHWYGVGWWLNRDRRKVMDNDGIVLHGVCDPLPLYVNGRRSIKEAIYFATKLFPEIVKENFDVIDCQEFPYFPCYSSKLSSLGNKSSFIITWLEVWYNYWYEYLGKFGIFGKIVEKLTAKLTSSNVAISNLTKKYLKMIGASNVCVIPCGIDVEKIAGIKKANESSDIVFAGRLIKDKNIDILLRSISILKLDYPDISAIIIGDGPEKSRLIQLSKSLNIDKNVRFLGFIKNHDDVLSIMKSSKVFVFPSTREGFGIAVLEANACGLPVVTVDYEMNAAKDLIVDGLNGFVCPLSKEHLADRINNALVANMKLDCFKFSKKYDWNVISKKCESYYCTRI